MLKRKPQPVSLEPYGYSIAPRTPSTASTSRREEVDPPLPRPLAQSPADSLAAAVTVTSPPAEADQRTTSETGKGSGCLTLFLVVVVGLIGLVLGSTLLGPTRSTGSSYLSSDHDAGMACIMAEKFIKAQLKSPTSAEFDYADCRDHATRSGSTWMLRSYVDADNSFGAHIRSYYVAKLTNVPPSDTWRLVDLTFN